MEFTNKTSIQLEPGASEPFDIEVGGENYNTPQYFRPTLGDLSRLQYTRGRWAVGVVASAATSAVVTARLMAGSTEIAAVALDFDGGTAAGAQLDVDLSQAAGSAPLHVSVTVDTPGAASETARVRSWVEVAHPLVISNC